MKVKFFANIAELTKTKELVIDTVPDDIYALLLYLCSTYGERLRKEILSPDGKEVSAYIIVLINGRHIAHLAGKDSKLTSDDDVRIFPVLGGG